MKRLWSDEAKAYMLKHGSELSLDELIDGLRPIEGFARTRLAVRGMRNKMGLATRLSKPWTDMDISYLKRYYNLLSDETIGDNIGRTAAAVRNKRKLLRLILPQVEKKTTTPGRYVTKWQDTGVSWRLAFLYKVCADLTRDDIKHSIKRRNKDDTFLSAVWREPMVDTIPERSARWT